MSKKLLKTEYWSKAETIEKSLYKAVEAECDVTGQLERTQHELDNLINVVGRLLNNLASIHKKDQISAGEIAHILTGWNEMNARYVDESDDSN